MAGPDFYTILGVSHTASPDEIKAAHRELVKKYHPDLFPGAKQKAQANKKLQQINEAYAILSNAERRRQYDSRYPPRVTNVNPARSAGERRSTANFRRPPTVSARENLARRANEKFNQIAKTLSRRPGIPMAIFPARSARPDRRQRVTHGSLVPLPQRLGISSGAGPARFPSK